MNPILANAGVVFTFFAALFFAGRRLMRYLHIYQQDEYDTSRFLPWLWRVKAFDRRASLFLFLLVPVLIVGIVPYGSRFLAGLVFLGLALMEPDPRRQAKKPLVLTQRARRILSIALAGVAAVAAPLAFHGSIVNWILFVQLLPLFLCAANLALRPMEQKVQRRFLDEARARLAEINPKIIGVTGSFGKTSVKHILGHILDMNVRTYFAPGSINTVMGISRMIREQMPRDTEMFISEMGAYGIGSIARLCDLTPPDAGIITALGEAHYERFKSLDAVARAKFELAEAVLAKPEGKVTLHESVLAQPYAAAFVAQNRDRFIVCGVGEQADCRIAKAEQTPSGLALTLVWQGQSYDIAAPIYGLQHAENIAMSFAAACALGLAPARLVTALASLPQIKHRLEVKREGNGVTLIDDAYNSNPKGFAAALDLLPVLREGQGRRVLMTPGLVEMGARHDEVHAALGAKAAEAADLVFVIKPDRIPTFVDAFSKAAGGQARERLHLCAAMSEALAWISTQARSGDVILIENDLPDVYERTLKL